MTARELLELGHEPVVTAERELRLDPRFDGGKTFLLEPADLGLREFVVGEVGERRSPPERERLTQ